MTFLLNKKLTISIFPPRRNSDSLIFHFWRKGKYSLFTFEKIVKYLGNKILPARSPTSSRPSDRGQILWSGLRQRLHLSDFARVFRTASPFSRTIFLEFTRKKLLEGLILPYRREDCRRLSYQCHSRRRFFDFAIQNHKSLEIIQ